MFGVPRTGEGGGMDFFFVIFCVSKLISFACEFASGRDLFACIFPFVSSFVRGWYLLRCRSGVM